MSHPVIQAAYGGDDGTVMAALREGGDVDEIDEETGWRPLHAAVMTDSTEAAECLLRFGAGVNAHGPGGMTPLHIAARDNTLAMAKLLLVHGADTGALDQAGHTPAALAAESGCADSQRLLASIAEGPEVLEALRQERAARKSAPARAAPAHSGTLEYSQQDFYEDAHRSPPPPFNDQPDYPVVTAAYYGDVCAVQWALREGGDVNEVDPRQQWTPLHAAVLTNAEDAVEYLVAMGADLNAPGPGRMTPLHLAARDDGAAIAERLLRARADAGALDERGRTPRAVADECGRTDALRVLEGHQR
mmetsp:Transcript_86397/g.244923  ORF Transcript_86397/g.244923 Transcript_86397/m.244923 type:complete len:303 (-) Transcript_86397:45-953(-)